MKKLIFFLIIVFLVGCCKETIVYEYYIVADGHIDSSGTWNGNALKRAINYLDEYNANGIWIPAGTYYYDEPLTIPPNITIQGGKHETTKKTY